MKTAYVLEHHLGDNGSVDEGMILEDISDKRFQALEKKGLVREATAAEIKEGYKAPFLASGTVIAGEEVPAEGGSKAAQEPANKAAAKHQSK